MTPFGFLLAAIALTGAHAANWVKGTPNWPAGASCSGPLLPDESCGGADAPPLLIHLLLDVSGSVKSDCPSTPDTDCFQKDTVDFIDKFMKAVRCTRYNLPDEKTKLFLATWSSGTTYDEMGADGNGWNTQFELGPAWGVASGKMADVMDVLVDLVPQGGTHPGAALKKAADLAVGSDPAGTGAKNLVVLFTDGEMGGGCTGGGFNGCNLNQLKGQISTQVERVKEVTDAQLITVGIGGNVNEDILKGYASDDDNGDPLYLSVNNFNELDSIIDSLLAEIECPVSGGGALEEPPTKYPTTGPPTVAAAPTTGAPIVTSRDTDSPTRSPIGDDTASPTSGATLSAALGAAPLLVLAGCALQLFY